MSNSKKFTAAKLNTIPSFVDRQTGTCNIISLYDGNKSYGVIIQELYDSVIANDKSNHVEVLKLRYRLYQVQEGVSFLKLSPFLFCPKYKSCHIQYDKGDLWAILKQSDVNGLPSLATLTEKGSSWNTFRLLKKILYK